MLAYSSKPFDSDRHLFEIKWDGARCLLFLQDRRLRLQNRRLQDISVRYPELWDLAGNSGPEPHPGRGTGGPGSGQVGLP